LQGELATLARALEPLEMAAGHIEPPVGLAERTCEFVARRTMVVALAGADGFAGEDLRHSTRWSLADWRLADWAVAAGIFLAATMIFFPAVSHSRYSARLAACQDNLRRIGVALAQYSGLHKEYFPEVPAEGNLAAAGIYAPILVHDQLLTDPRVLICPGSELADQGGKFHIPTLEELSKARGEENLASLQRSMGGSYGYHLGYVSNGHAQPMKNLQRPTFGLMADAPRPLEAEPGSLPVAPSSHHGGMGQNVLFEDGHVGYLTTSKAAGRDEIYVNDHGQVAAGLHRDDAVIAGSGTRPAGTK
jgi:hypothetical protein